MEPLKIFWGTVTTDQNIGNLMGYRIHNETLRKYTEMRDDVVLVDTVDEADACLYITTPEVFDSRPNKPTFLFTMFEATKLHEMYAEKIKKSDFILVPSNFVKGIFSPHFPEDKIWVVHHGVEEYFGFISRKRNPKKFRYLWIGAPNPRKGYQELIYVWGKLGLANNPEIELYIKTTRVPNVTIQKKGNVILDSRIATQEEMIKIYQDAHCFVWPTRGEGFGLCVAPETMLQTNSGPILMKDIQIGDSVMSSDGDYHLVTNKFKRKAEVRKISILGTPPIMITDDHPVLAVDKNKRYLFEKYGENIPLHDTVYKKGIPPENVLKWKLAKNLQNGDLVAVPRPKWNKPLPITIDLLDWVKDDLKVCYDERYIWSPMGFSPNGSDWSLSRICREFSETMRVAEAATFAISNGKKTVPGSRTHNLALKLISVGYEKPIQKKIERIIPINSDFLRLVGWYLAEGSGFGGRGIEFSLSDKEESIGKYLGKVIGDLFGLDFALTFAKDKHVCSVLACSSILSLFFKKLCGQGATGKKIHPILLQSSSHLAPLVEGYIQGDGNICKDWGGYSSFTVSTELAWQLKFLFASIGVHCSVFPSNCNIKNGGNPGWVNGIGGDGAERLCDWSKGLLNNRTKGNRKAHKHAIVCDDYLFVPIKSIGPLSEKTDVMDISVKNTHNFIGNGIVLHNCLAEAMATGLPCIATGFSGILDFFDKKVGYPLKYKLGLMDMTSPIHGDMGKVEAALPDVQDLVDNMVYIRHNYKNALEKGRLASHRIKSRFTWENSAETLVNSIREGLSRGNN